MLFKDTIPDILKEHPNVSRFMDVLDALQSYKREVMSDSLRVNNSAVLMDRKWLLKKLAEFGTSNFPLEYPIQPMRQFLLNADTIYRTRGSKIGVEMYCSVLSLGEVVVDDSMFYASSKMIVLDSLLQGYLTEDNSDKFYHLVGSSSEINPEVALRVAISSKYFNGDYPEESGIIKKYIESTINNQLGFSPDKKVVFTYGGRDSFYFHKLLNPYFV